MRRITTMNLLLLCAAMVTLQPAFAQDQYVLQYRFQKGKAYLFTDTISVKSTQEMMGQEMKSTSDLAATTRIVATEVMDNGATVLMISPDAMRISVKSARMDTTIIPKELIGKRSRVTVSRLGETSRRETIDSVRLTGMTRAAGQRELVRFHVFPAKPLTVGEKWTSTRPDTTESMGGQVVSLYTLDYTVLSEEEVRGKECLKISYAGKIIVTGTGTMMGSNFFIEGNGTTSGTFLADRANGLPLMEDSRTDMESTYAITGQQNMTIPSSQSFTTRRALIFE